MLFQQPEKKDGEPPMKKPTLLAIGMHLSLLELVSGLPVIKHSYFLFCYFEGVEGGFAADEEAEKYEYVDSYNLFVQPTNEFIPLPNASLPAKVRNI